MSLLSHCECSSYISINFNLQDLFHKASPLQIINCYLFCATYEATKCMPYSCFCITSIHTTFQEFLLKLVTLTFKNSTLFFHNLFTGGRTAKSVQRLDCCRDSPGFECEKKQKISSPPKLQADSGDHPTSYSQGNGLLARRNTQIKIHLLITVLIINIIHIIIIIIIIIIRRFLRNFEFT